MDKVKRTGAVQVDNRRPSKPAATSARSTGSAGKRGRAAAEAPAPTYDGPTKTGKAPARKTRGARKAKPATGQVQRPRASARRAEFGDQMPPRRRRAAAAGGGAGGGEQYIRLRVRARGSRLTILDSHLVDGPLAQAQGFSTANVYEVTMGDRLLHAGALPDLGMQRSFVNPDGSPEQQGHHFTERPIYEFTARVPAHEVTAETISQIAVRVHRVKEEARSGRLGVEALAVQFPREVRPVAELVGLPDSVLPEAIEARGGRTPSL
jgi:hypothetical protein